MSFMEFSGMVMWFLVLILAIAYLSLIILDRLEILKFEQKIKRFEQKIEREKQSQIEIGNAIFNNAYWLSGDEFNDVHPYVLMKTLGEMIRFSDSSFINMNDFREKCIDETNIYKGDQLR